MYTFKYIRFFEDIDNTQVGIVGGKNASLGEMYQKLGKQGINIPYGFAITATAYWHLLSSNNIHEKLQSLLAKLDTHTFSNLNAIGETCRALVLESILPEDLKIEILAAYRQLLTTDEQMSFAVRSSATAEDLPNASFAGQQESYLNVNGELPLLKTVQKCFASLFTNRAIKYRHDNGFEHMKVALSIGVQQMVRSDLASAGVAFTLDPETGHREMIYITGSWGLGENVVQGAVTPDEFYVYKPALVKNKIAILSKKLGSKDVTMVYGSSSADEVNTLNVPTPEDRRKQFVLNDVEVTRLANWCKVIENHYGRPMDIEWAKDGLTGKMFIVQARPETVHTLITQQMSTKEYHILSKPPYITSGIAVGNRIISGKARVLDNPKEADRLKSGEILVTGITNPDWDPILKKAAAIITEKGGRTSHAAIVAREAGAIAVVGTNNASQMIKDGQEITVSCAEGKVGYVYEGKVEWEENIIDFSSMELPETQPMFILGDPDKALRLATLPNCGVGLMRLEFVINNTIQIHPMALVKYDMLKDTTAKVRISDLTNGYADKKQYFVDKLSQAVGTIAAAFYPQVVIVRMSDFKSNEYANLIGGREFEPLEENPMIGFRGASRYYNERYKEAFQLECEAIKVVRNDMGLDNVKLMIPFCRTLEEGKKVIELMRSFGLRQGENGLEVYVMAEIPSNIILADEFAEIFDGFSIGSNDLTQLTLGIDRDSALVSNLFDENNEAILQSLEKIIHVAKRKGKKIGICGQGPSDSKDFAAFLVGCGIDSISFNPDAYLQGFKNIVDAEWERIYNY